MAISKEGLASVISRAQEAKKKGEPFAYSITGDNLIELLEGGTEDSKKFAKEDALLGNKRFRAIAKESKFVLTAAALPILEAFNPTVETKEELARKKLSSATPAK